MKLKLLLTFALLLTAVTGACAEFPKPGDEWDSEDHGVGSTDHFSALKIWMFENKFVSLPSHLKTIEPMEVHRGAGTMCNTETSKVIRRTDPMILSLMILLVLICSTKVSEKSDMAKS